MKTPYVVLCEYHPSREPWRAWRIGRELTAITGKLGLRPHVDAVHGAQETSSWCSPELHAEVRRFTQAHAQGEGWHQDGDLKPGSGMDHAQVLWCNVNPTQFQWNGKVYQPKPFEVVIARNLGCYHRRPPDAPRERWVFRQRVALPRFISLV